MIQNPTELSRRLFRFLASVLEGRPQTDGPLLIERGALREFYRQPDPHVVGLLAHCRHRLSVEVRRQPAAESDVAVTRGVLGLTIAACNCLPGASLLVSHRPGGAKAVEAFTQELIQQVPHADNVADMLTYHSVLRSVVPRPEASPAPASDLLAELIGRSPLTTLTALDAYSHPDLKPLETELLQPGSEGPRREVPACGTEQPPAGSFRHGSPWQQSVDQILGDRALAGWLRRQWLDMPETRRVCRNQGLILEYLRRGKVPAHRDFILEFYEAWDRLRFRDSFGAKPQAPAFPQHPQAVFDPREIDAFGLPLNDLPSDPGLFDVIEQHLRAQGHGDAVLRLNRWGNEYLLKFLPLIEIIIEESRLPEKYRHLTTGLALAIKRLLPYAVWNIRRRIVFQPVTFGSEAAS